MSEKKFLVVILAGSLGALGAVPAAANEVDRTGDRGGYVIPGNTDGVNPAFHPKYFGKPANYSCFERFRTYGCGVGNLSRL